MLPFGSPMQIGANSSSVDEVFATNLYTGNNQSRQIVNNLKNVSRGGLVWLKNRSQNGDHYIYDHTKPSGLIVNSTGQVFGSTYVTLVNNGYTVSGDNPVALNGSNFVGWNFRRSRRFFDIVTYTGNNVSGRQIAHNLRIKPGMIIVKRLDADGTWYVQHVSLTSTFYLLLNTADASTNRTNIWNNTEPTQTSFTLGSGATNISGGQYVAYIFAHDPSLTGIIQCGLYTGNGSLSGPVVDLGWEPQWLLVKRTDNGATTDWVILDNKRTTSNPRNVRLSPNLSSAESGSGGVAVNSTSSGFQVNSTNGILNTNGGTYVYMAIRKGRL